MTAAHPDRELINRLLGPFEPEVSLRDLVAAADGPSREWHVR